MQLINPTKGYLSIHRCCNRILIVLKSPTEWEIIYGRTNLPENHLKLLHIYLRYYALNDFMNIPTPCRYFVRCSVKKSKVQFKK